MYAMIKLQMRFKLFKVFFVFTSNGSLKASVLKIDFLKYFMCSRFKPL